MYAHIGIHTHTLVRPSVHAHAHTHLHTHTQMSYKIWDNSSSGDPNMTISAFPPIGEQQAHCKFYQEIHQKPSVRILSKEKAPPLLWLFLWASVWAASIRDFFNLMTFTTYPMPRPLGRHTKDTQKGINNGKASLRWPVILPTSIRWKYWINS